MTEKRLRRPRDPVQLGKLIGDILTGQVEDRAPTAEEAEKNPAAVALGKRGGTARAAKMSAKQRKDIAKKAASVRWAARTK